MNQHALPSNLYLVVPGDLPVEQHMDELQKVQLCRSLNQLLQALGQTSNQAALTMITQELANFNLSGIFPSQPSVTKTPLKPWEVEDYNNYFQVSHVRARDPAFCVVHSLLTAYQLFLAFDDRDREFDPFQVRLLKEGLKSYVFLLARVFGLQLEDV